MGREGSLEDLAECLALHESLGLPYSAASKGILPEMFRTLLIEGAMQLFLVENRASWMGSRVVSFSAALFVTDTFCAQARSTLPPYLGEALARHYHSGKPAVLNRAQLSAANIDDGLNVVICFTGWRRDGLSWEQLREVHEKQSAQFHRGLGGYCIKELLADSIGHEYLQRMLHAGFRLRRTYSRHFRKHDLPLPASFLRPWLVGLTREEAFAYPGSNVAGLFVTAPPRFHFNPSEQILLRHALQEETGEELAASLCISPWTVKKRWQAIYQRVANIDGDLLPPISASGSPTASRGAERRRHLLSYLRQHPEELRPSRPERETRSPRNARNVSRRTHTRSAVIS
ncbi:MAG: hypothetical protein QOH01_2621 [Verrucomicrobiota bacterium]|jgi:hypothetical protein